MERQRVARRALTALGHPLALAAMAVLVLNAWVFQPQVPSWWTGKLGDAMWLVFVPFGVVLGLAALGLPERRAGRVALAITGLGFVAVKTIPACNALVAGAWVRVTGTPAKLARDPSDLWVLPALLVAAWIWQHSAPRPARRWRSWLALACAAGAVLADMPAPQNLGLYCFAPQATTLYALNKISQRDDLGQTRDSYAAYASEDAGLSWRVTVSGSADPWKGIDKGDPCKTRGREATWTLADPRNDKVLYLFVAGRGIYRSEDGGANFKREHVLGPAESVADAVIDPGTGYVIATTRGRFVLVRTSPEWKTVTVIP